MFPTFGLPAELVSENGSAFAGDKFEEFPKNNGIKCTPILLYHPTSSGQLERYMQSAKKCL